MDLKKLLKYCIVFFCFLGILGLFSLCFINEYVLLQARDSFFLENKEYEDMDCILVLGAGVKNEKPSPMLQDRLETATWLYKEGYAKKIIMSGDHGREDYNEVTVMKQYALEQGVPSEDIFMDHAGFSTYDSIYRAKYIFGVKKMFVVSQEYHLYRALFLSHVFSIDAVGVPAKKVSYSGQFFREMRELLARDKDFLKSLFLPPATYLGHQILITGDGNITNG